MLIRRIVEDYEAKLAPPTDDPAVSTARGKAEWERFANGDHEFDVRVRGIALPDGASLDVLLDDRLVGHLALVRGRGRLTLSSRDGAAVPAARTGQTLRVVHRAVTVLVGTFVPD